MVYFTWLLPLLTEISSQHMHSGQENSSKKWTNFTEISDSKCLIFTYGKKSWNQCNWFHEFFLKISGSLWCGGVVVAWSFGIFFCYNMHRKMTIAFILTLGVSVNFEHRHNLTENLSFWSYQLTMIVATKWKCGY